MRINFLEYTRRQFMKQAAIAAAVGAPQETLPGELTWMVVSTIIGISRYTSVP